jgi:pyruvate dehydrogenase E2 component (dihydrolipoamide acetyltransferase)
MATPITMPKLGLTMKEGKVVQWHKQDGETVEEGELLVVVMSKKITYEVQAPGSGTVRILTPAKETCDVADPIGFILEPGESLQEVAGTPEQRVRPARSAARAPAESSAEVGSSGPREGVRASPAAKRLARELGVDVAAVAAVTEGPVQESDVRAFLQPREAAPEKPDETLDLRSSPAARRLAGELRLDLEDVARVKETPGPITERDVRAAQERLAAPAGPEIAATPLARRMAEEEGLDLSQIEGTGPGGRVTEADVLRALEGEGTAPAASGRIPVTGMREAIAEAMVESLRSTAQLTLTARADVTELAALRDELRGRWDARITYNALFVKAVALALREHPLLNSRLVEDEIVLLEEVNVGVAVALEDGLIVPVIRAADQKSVMDIHHEVRALAERARAGTLSVDEVEGGTFTVTNLGAFGVRSFTPILNQPQVGILGVGGVSREPAVVGDQVVPRHLVALSLTIDHRVVDGAPGAAFLQTLVTLLEHPALMFAPVTNDRERGVA